MLKQIRFPLLSVLLLVGCNRSTLIHSYQPIKENCWNRTDSITFNLPSLNTEDKCSVLIGLRVTNNFPYESLVMEVTQNYQNPISHRVDTIKYLLTDKNGNFTEKGLNYFQYETQGVPLDLKKGQTGEITIRHIMHRETLPGIMDVGVRVIR